MNKINNEQLVTIIKELAENSIFGATFVKKDGTVRDMVCRLGVKKGTNGKGLNFEPVERGLLPVFDMKSQGFRMINLSTLTELRIKGKVYRISN